MIFFIRLSSASVVFVLINAFIEGTKMLQWDNF